ncbi:RNA polymerase sigma factor [Pedobacter sp. AW31-3R]|uniref:RNA polymerase sigma factor n=1 Tax=Pedobacter sp. AW31-3R TaxID=3445781 RepID=UPI003FA06D9B
MQYYKNDSEAAQALKDGNMRALEYFYHAYQKTLLLFLRSYCRDEMLVEEMSQEAFIQLWENKHKVNPEQNVKNLLFTIAKNKVIDQTRQIRNQARIIKLQPVENAGNFTLDQVILADYNRLLSNALLQLPARSREVYALSRTTQLSNVEISNQLNISVKTVEKNITKTLHFLRSFLKNQQILLLFVFFYQYFF